jgi:hypothetical protein
MPGGSGLRQPLIDVRLDEPQRPVLATEANGRNASGARRVVDPRARHRELARDVIAPQQHGIHRQTDGSDEAGQFDGVDTSSPIQQLTDSEGIR